MGEEGFYIKLPLVIFISRVCFVCQFQSGLEVSEFLLTSEPSVSPDCAEPK